MPGVLQLAARGSTCRPHILSTRLTCLTCSHRPAHPSPSWRIVIITRGDRQQSLNSLAPAPSLRHRTLHGFPPRHLHPDVVPCNCSTGRSYSIMNPWIVDGIAVDAEPEVAWPATDRQGPDRTNGGAGEENQEDTVQNNHAGSHLYLRRTRGKLASRNLRKSRRPSRPGAIVDWISQFSHLQHYRRTPRHKLDLSYNYPHTRKFGGLRRRRLLSRLAARLSPDQDAPVTLYSILLRYIQSTVMRDAMSEPSSEYELRSEELVLLESRAFSRDHVIRWGRSLTTPSAHTALSRLCKPDQDPPFFLLLMFLRRIQVPRRVLAEYIRHVESRLQAESVGWENLKILVIRLTRHARIVWPEILPMVASVFTSEAARIQAANIRTTPNAMSSDVTRFSNIFLRLLSLPSTLKPILSSFYQETAQFQVLRFMAGTSPPLHVTRLGFQALGRTQLAHAKTTQERDWAILKGPSWPPWMHQRTAMDEGKGYEQGISRATAIIHRCLEAGYPSGKREELAAIYAGWNSDSSPTIQTRTLLPTLLSTRMSRQRLEQLIWAARVTTTRTRAEAWACFLAYEASGLPARPLVYLAMFEKVHYDDACGAHSPFAKDPHDAETHMDAMLLAGDMKEPIPEPSSPLDMVYLAEPVPTWVELYNRMKRKGIVPSQRLMAFLLDTTPDFDLGLDMLRETQDRFDGGIRRLLDASLLQASAHQLPGYFLTSFIRFLCRFGDFYGSPSIVPSTPGPEQHRRRLRLDRHYLVEYAYAILAHLRPNYRPAWTAYMLKVVHSRGAIRSGRLLRRSTAQYKAISALLDMMREEGMEQDEVQFQVLCNTVHYAARCGRQGHLVNAAEVEHMFSKAPGQIRTSFRSLVNVDASAGTGPVAPHIPSPWVLHSYVRALGVLCDYEGIYSFTTWATDNSLAICARAGSQHGGAEMVRRTLVAIRIALDGRMGRRWRSAPQDLVYLVRTQVESVPEWGGWPTLREAKQYVRHGQLAGGQ